MSVEVVGEYCVSIEEWTDYFVFTVLDSPKTGVITCVTYDFSDILFPSYSEVCKLELNALLTKVSLATSQGG